MIYSFKSSFPDILFIASVDILLNSLNTANPFITVFNHALFFRCIVKYLLAEYDLSYSPLFPLYVFFMSSDFAPEESHPRSRPNQRDMGTSREYVY